MYSDLSFHVTFDYMDFLTLIALSVGLRRFIRIVQRFPCSTCIKQREWRRCKITNFGFVLERNHGYTGPD